MLHLIAVSGGTIPKIPAVTDLVNRVATRSGELRSKGVHPALAEVPIEKSGIRFTSTDAVSLRQPYFEVTLRRMVAWGLFLRLKNQWSLGLVWIACNL